MRGRTFSLELRVEAVFRRHAGFERHSQRGGRVRSVNDTIRTVDERIRVADPGVLPLIDGRALRARLVGE